MKIINIHYIRAAIEEATGIRLSLNETKDYLVSENMIPKSKAKNIIFRGYSDLYDYFYGQDYNVITSKTVE